MNKVKEVFGGATSSVVAMADQMATQFGAVKQTTLDAAANLGLVAQGAGMTSQAAAAMSIRLTRLADDASSFYNVPLDQALEKIRSGLVGEAEPLRSFGVLLNEDAVKAQALAMGFTPLHGALTEQEKVLARVELITKGLAKAQGDHERTMGSYANQIRKLTGEWENMKAEMGGPIAGGAAMSMESIRNEGVGGFMGKSLAGLAAMMPGAVGKGARARFGDNPFQAEADKMAGVVSGLPGAGPGKMDPLAAWGNAQIQMAQRQALQHFEANKFGGGGFGAFGMMGNLGGMIGNMANRDQLDAEIAAKRRQINAWGGSHVTGAEEFMKSAQEKILTPGDETAYKQLNELVKCREALQVIAGKQEGKARVGGVVLKGREA